MLDVYERVEVEDANVVQSFYFKIFEPWRVTQLSHAVSPCAHGCVIIVASFAEKLTFSGGTDRTLHLD